MTEEVSGHTGRLRGHRDGEAGAAGWVEAGEPGRPGKLGGGATPGDVG